MSNTINLSELQNLFIDAIEQGSTYWIFFNLGETNLLKEMNESYPNLCMSERIWKYLKDGQSFKVYDLETDDYLGDLTFENFQSAAESLKQSHPHYYDEIINDNWDSNASDIVMQIAVMGQVTFG